MGISAQSVEEEIAGLMLSVIALITPCGCDRMFTCIWASHVYQRVACIPAETLEEQTTSDITLSSVLQSQANTVVERQSHWL